MFQGAKVPPMVLSLLGAKVRGNESSSYRIYHGARLRVDRGDIGKFRSLVLCHPPFGHLIFSSFPRVTDIAPLSVLAVMYDKIKLKFHYIPGLEVGICRLPL